MRSRVAIWCLAAVILGWCDSALAQKSGGVLRIFHRDNPVSASILEETAASTVVAFMPVFNNLVMFDPSVSQNTPESIIPDLAESWNWNDDKTELTFKLRKDVKWHDGFPFTSSDVECTFNLWTGRARLTSCAAIREMTAVKILSTGSQQAAPPETMATILLPSASRHFLNMSLLAIASRKLYHAP